MAIERERLIFRMLSEQGEVSILELSARLGISPSRVRHNLAGMRNRRFIQRTHGGVTLANVINYNPLPIHKPAVDPIELRAIGHEAFLRVERGDVIGLSGGRICTELALQLRLSEGITVVTHAVNIAAELVALPGIQVILTGGALDTHSFELGGRMVAACLEGIHLNKFFVGTDGVTLEHGVTNHNEASALVGRCFSQHSDQTILLADSSKFTRSHLARSLEINEVSLLITSDRTSPEIVAQFEAAGIKCRVARCQPENSTLEGGLTQPEGTPK